MSGKGRKCEEKSVSNVTDHDYVSVEANKRLLEECAENLPITPSKVHVMKKVRADHEDDISHADILEAIYSLGKRFDKQEKKLEELTRKMEENCSVISEVKEDLKVHKRKAAELELEFSDLKKDNKALRIRVGELDCHKRRWNLRIKGLPGKQNENIKADVITLLSKIAPGAPWEMNTRQLIMQFSKRIYRDQIWALSKGSTVCKEKTSTKRIERREKCFGHALNKRDQKGKWRSFVALLLSSRESKFFHDDENLEKGK